MKAFLRPALRFLLREKLFVSINVFGLALGICSALLIFLIVRHDLRFDTFHEKADRIYRVNWHEEEDGGLDKLPTAPVPAGHALLDALPSVINQAKVYDISRSTLLSGGREFNQERIALVESTYFEIFDFELLEGDEVSLNEPNQVILSQSAASRFLPNPRIGNLLQIRHLSIGDHPVRVAGIMADPPSYTDLPFEVLISQKTLTALVQGSWHTWNTDFSSFLLVAEGSAPTKDELEGILEQHMGDKASTVDLYLQPLLDIHSNAEYRNYNNRTVPMKVIWALTTIGVALLLIACFNFVNLTTAHAIKRSREVGIRKVLGATRQGLLGKFIGEAALMTLIALSIAVPLAVFLHPFAQQLVGTPFDFIDFLSVANWLALLVFLALVILLSGLYPAYVLSGFTPLSISGLASGTLGSGTLRRVLVFFQFFVSQLLLIGLFVVQAQLQYFLETDMGFDKEGVVTFPLPRGAENGRTVKNEMEKLAGIKGASLTSSSHRSRSGVSSNGVRMISADEDYLDIYRLDLLAGRNYHVSDSSQEALVNEAQIREMGIVDPHEALGEKLREDKVIVGVVRDFYVGSLYQDIQPTAIIPNKVNFNNVSIRLSGNNIGSILDRLEQTWYTFYPNEPFEYYFLDESIAAYYESEQRVSNIMFAFTFVALVIGAIGLYGLVTFVVHRRLKEIGVRKVLGATFTQIVQTVSKEFLLLPGLAFLASAPLGWYLSEIWLSDYLNRIDVGPLIFVLAVMSSLAVALLAVLQKSFVAARVNPVEILRSE